MLEVTDYRSEQRIQVAENDFEEKMTWEQAIVACKNLGDGWRLPYYSELDTLYYELRQKGMGNFKDAYYWSSKENNKKDAWTYNFSDDIANYSKDKTCTYYVRAVRTL